MTKPNGLSLAAPASRLSLHDADVESVDSPPLVGSVFDLNLHEYSPVRQGQHMLCGILFASFNRCEIATRAAQTSFNLPLTSKKKAHSMLFKTLLRCALALTTAAAISSAQAAPVTWTLVGVTLQTINVSGSFTYDASLNQYSNVAITAGAVSYDTSELSPNPFGVDATGLELVDGYVFGDNVGKSILNLDFLSPLTDAGGTIGLVTGFPTFQGTCLSADCGAGSILFSGTGGSVTSAAVPEPASLALVGVALLALRLRRNKQA